ncbi:MAX gene-associated protein-like isoform X2 [Morone saxatilis]|uniref:MAX gene-associated protein-like isoform X2 n=1 Tax=Morone saxatilis TaxID=34816 RepID=UPI0015E237B7|nr:MAX gene-associated protein-like isoform X2 [Morone saxatilis]
MPEPTEEEMPVEREEPTEGEMPVKREMPVEREEATEGEMPVEPEVPVERERPVGSDTENSSDFGEDTDSEEQSSTNNDSERQRHYHNATEKRRRGEMRQLFERLRTEVGLSDDKASKISTLTMAVVVIKELRMFEAYLKKKKKKLTKRRDHYLSTIAPTTGKGEQRLRKMQHLSSNQRKRLPAGGGASEPSSGDTTDDDIMITSSNLKQQAPPTALSAPPTTTPVRTNSNVATPSQVPAGISQNASLLRDRPRTVPNILSRSKNPAKPSSLLTKNLEEAPSFLLPAEILSLVSAALPGQPVLTLGPMMGGPTVLQTSPTPGVASVTLNIPSLTNQIHLTSLHHPPTDFNNLLQLVQPSITPQQQQQQQQQQPQSQPQGQPQAPQQHVPPPPAVVSAGPDQDHAPSQSTSPSAFSTQGPGSSLQAEVPEQEGTTEDPEVPVGGSSKPEQQEGSREDPDQESLTSLLNEIVFLNQQTALQLPGQPPSEAGLPEEGPPEAGPGQSPWLLQLDSDSDDTVNTETVESGPQPRPAYGGSTAGVLAPPPLLQMKVGRSTVAAPTRSASPAVEGGGRGGRAGRREGGVTWRPMPRLVPLGLRGNPPC